MLLGGHGPFRGLVAPLALYLILPSKIPCGNWRLKTD